MTRKATPDVMGETNPHPSPLPRGEGTGGGRDASLEAMFGAPADGGRVEVALALIDDNPFQERSEYGDLTDLANDIREHGLLQAPVARRAAGGRYELAFGHRRKRACELAGMSSMALMVVGWLSDERMATVAFSENEQRQDVTAIDKALAIQTMQTRFGWSLQEIADKLSMSRPAVSNLLRMLQLPEQVQTAVQSGEISPRQAAALIPLAALPPAALKRVPTWADGLDKMVQDAKDGVSSDGLRKRVEQSIRSVSNGLPDHWRNHDFGDLAGIEAGRCTGCQHVMRRGDDQMCAIKSCWDAKSSAWLAIKQAEIVAATGVLMLPEKFDYQERETFYSSHRRVLKLEEPPAPPSFQCPNLRLQNGYKDSYDYVCYHPGKKGCKCLADAERAGKKDGKARWKVLREGTNAALTERLAEFPLDALRLLAGQLAKYSDRSQVQSWTDEQCVPVIAKQLIATAGVYDPENNAGKAQEAMETLLRTAGITIMPWSLAGQVEAGDGDAGFPVL